MAGTSSNATMNTITDELQKVRRHLDKLDINADYVVTWNGALNVLEVTVAASVFLMLQCVGTSGASLKFMSLLTFSHAVQGLHFLLSGLISRSISALLANSFYYMSFQLVASGVFILLGICSLCTCRLGILECAEGIVAGASAVGLFLVHLIHTAFLLTGNVSAKLNVNVTKILRGINLTNVLHPPDA